MDGGSHLDGAAPLIWQLIDSSGVGGAERVAQSVALGLRRRGLRSDVALLQTYGPNPWIDQLRADGVEPIQLDGGFRSLVGALRDARPDVLHTHGYKANILGRAAARLAGVRRSVATFHSGDLFPWPASAWQRLDAWTSFLGGRVAVSPGVQKQLPFSSELIPNFTATPDAAPEGALPRRVGFVGRLSREKGPDLFCAFARACAAIAPDVEFVAYGDGAMRGDLEAAFGDVVSFKGVAVDMDAVWPTLGLLAMPSRFEGLPLAALEAAAAGVPILAADVGAVASTVVDGKSGWLHASGDVEGAVSGFAQWRRLDTEQHRALRRAAWRHIRDNFSEQRSIEHHLKLYQIHGV